MVQKEERPLDSGLLKARNEMRKLFHCRYGQRAIKKMTTEIIIQNAEQRTWKSQCLENVSVPEAGGVITQRYYHGPPRLLLDESVGCGAHACLPGEKQCFQLDLRSSDLEDLCLQSLICICTDFDGSSLTLSLRFKAPDSWGPRRGQQVFWFLHMGRL